MLIIRQEQMDVLRMAARRSFEDSMVEHLGGAFPHLLGAIGAGQMRLAVELGMRRAAGYGFDLRGPVCLYLELMLLFGSAFDTDPQYPWAAEILTDRDGQPQMQRATRLYQRALDYRRQVAGPADAYALRALGNIRGLFSQTIGFAVDELVPFMLSEINLLYPEKAAYVGDECLTALIRKAGQGASNIRFTSPRGVALVVVLMLVLGHGCGADPIYPWIARTLKNGAITDPDAKAKRLEETTLAWLEQVQTHLAATDANPGKGVPTPPDTSPGADLHCDGVVQTGPPEDGIQARERGQAHARVGTEPTAAEVGQPPSSRSGDAADSDLAPG